LKKESLHINLEADFGLIAEARALLGPTDPFFEALFEVYERNLLPVGWQDETLPASFAVFQARVPALG
jgi:hypothetical protein